MARRQIMTFAHAAGLRISLTRVWNYGKDMPAILDIAKCCRFARYGAIHTQMSCREKGDEAMALDVPRYCSWRRRSLWQARSRLLLEH
jgi:hypothetical protein